jgi:ankyrin repeat protein
MQEPNENQNKSLEMKNYKNIIDNSQLASPFSIKSNNNSFPENNKENLDSNKPYLISDNSQSAINPLSKSHENLDTSNNLINNNLFTAVEYNDIERVNELLKMDNSKINDLNEEGLSLLHIAVIKGNIKMIDLLLSYGADSNI